MKFYYKAYIGRHLVKVYTTREMYDSQCQYTVEYDEYFDNGGTLEEFGEKAEFSDFALLHCNNAPEELYTYNNAELEVLCEP
jgi:hypothetical protein